MSEEADIQKKILEYLKKRNVWHRRMNTGVAVMSGRRVRFGASGMPDIFARTEQGTVIWIEVKGPQGKLSEDQRKWKEDMERFGDTYILARSVEDVMDLYEGRDST